MDNNVIINNWAIYIALFTSFASIIVAIVNGIINYKIIKSNNEISTKKMQFDYSIERYKLINNDYSNAIQCFINEACNYIQIIFLTTTDSTQAYLDFITAYFKLYAYCNSEGKEALNYFFNILMMDKNSKDTKIYKTLAENLLRDLRDTIQKLDVINPIND